MEKSTPIIPVVWEDVHDYPTHDGTCILRQIYWKDETKTDEKGGYIGSITLRYDDDELVLDWEDDQNPGEWMDMLFGLMGMFE